MGDHTKSVPCSVHECCSVAECSRPEVVALWVKIRALGNREIKEHSCLSESTFKREFSLVTPKWTGNRIIFK